MRGGAAERGILLVFTTPLWVLPVGVGGGGVSTRTAVSFTEFLFSADNHLEKGK